MKPVTAQKGSSRPGVAGGFTLIELMVVVAVVAILAAIAIPSYQESVRKSRRGQAKADLVEVATLAERYRTVNNQYTGFALAHDVSPSTGTAYYNLAIDVSDTGSEFTATATPIAGTPQQVDRCGTLAITQAGARFHSTGTDNECSFGSTGP